MPYAAVVELAVGAFDVARLAAEHKGVKDDEARARQLAAWEAYSLARGLPLMEGGMGVTGRVDDLPFSISAGSARATSEPVVVVRAPRRHPSSSTLTLERPGSLARLASRLGLGDPPAIEHELAQVFHIATTDAVAARSLLTPERAAEILGLADIVSLDVGPGDVTLSLLGRTAEWRAIEAGIALVLSLSTFRVETAPYR